MIWAIIFILGGLTYLIRLAFIVLWGRLRLPGWVQRALYFVPVAVLSAIITPELVTYDQHLALSFSNPRLLAGAIAVGVAYRTRNVFLTILVGMVAYWLLRWLLPGA
ncbi:AzlD domain-containing protein [Thermanaerothrix sp. 4228-RoL]|uniref:AzlD domain-containing protein n=1 Tax=Thermanaerothrix solaris TaxID=3058434 RepID=A0ABU3NN70_9CHLR|nr:AzlD domain-containing protein [Thermanaerothrix sp. 4228-RoL]MDT8897790.1 AzlD domain-containing protein [Thermanaerothrix sp. 4228-RoL]